MNEDRMQTLLAFIRRLTTAIATASLYDLQHQQVGYLAKLALEHLQKLFSEQAEVSLLQVDGELIFENTPLPTDLTVGKLLRALQQRGIGHLKLCAGVTQPEILALVALLLPKGLQAEDISSSEHIRFGRVVIDSEIAGQLDSTAELFQQFPALAEIEQLELDKFIDVYQSVRAGRRLNVRGLNEIVGSFVNAFSEQGNPLIALAPLRNMDEYTYTHSTNVCILNLAQAQMLGIEGQALHDIGIAAMLHDIGKLFVPQEVLQKPGKLDDEEWALIKDHPRLGAEYLANTPGIPRLAVITAYEHHLRYDLSGYPNVPQNWQQHPVSQMTTIADFFDALRTHRSYRLGMDMNKLTTIMLEEAGNALHPLLTRNLLNVIHKLNPHLQQQPSD